MRRVAFISDVHSNLEALDAVLERVGGAEVFCLGDLVGYGADPNIVIERLRDRQAVAVLGNHDVAALTGDARMFNPRAAEAIRWTSEHLTEGSKEYLRSLPSRVAKELDGVRAFFTHGSPDDSLLEYVELETHQHLFQRYLAELQVAVVGLGHTHRPFVWTGDGGTVFNPGSVGQPRDGDRRASFALAEFNEGRSHVVLMRTEYDVKAAADKILAAGLPSRLATRLFEGW